MPAGGLHAYLRGTGIEVLANSDNVVRAGLTGKHIDVPELLRLLDPSVEVPVVSVRVLGDGIAGYDTPAPEFRLHVVELAGRPVDLPGAGPRILLCAQGAAELSSQSGDMVKVARGESCFVSAADGVIRCAGSFRGYLASADPMGTSIELT
jgi:mannose-6-phosphate isomerase